MKITYNWLNELIKIDAFSVKEIAETLGQIGFEVSAISNLPGDTVFDIEIPANRGDCLGHLGIARELAAKLNLVLIYPETYSFPDPRSVNKVFSIDIEDTNLCKRYMGVVIEGIKVGPSPDLIAERLQKCGLRPINNIVDITNYIMLETGHPLHAFDIDKLSGERIVVRNANKGEKINALDNNNYVLSPDMLVIADNEKALALAGIVGGTESSVIESTSRIILESAVFKLENIRRTRQKLNVTTESSYRFERGSSYKNCDFASRRAISLITKYANGRFVSHNDICLPYEIKKIVLQIEKVNRILSTQYQVKDIVDALSRLEMKTEVKEDKIIVEVPPYRLDINEEIDLIEEVVRIQGYDTVPVEIKTYKTEHIIEEPLLELERKASDFLLAQGIQEVINYSFCSNKTLKDCKINREPIGLQNPLSEDWTFLRSSMLPGLLNNVMSNYNNTQARDMKFFELGKIFSTKEIGALGIICTGKESPEHWKYKSEKIDFYYISGIVHSLLKELDCNKWTADKSISEYFHPGVSAVIKDASSNTIAEYGLLQSTLHPKFLQGIYYAELFTENIQKTAGNDTPVFKEYSRLPGSKRDISIIVPEDVPYNRVADEILAGKDEFLIDISLFDVYLGDKIPKGKKSYSIRFYFTHFTRTFTDKEINEKVEQIIDRLKNLGISLRTA